MNKLIYTLVFCFLAQFAVGQTQTKYDYAKQLVKDGKYAQAITVLQTVLETGDAGIYPNALYLQAFSQYKVGKGQEARQSLFKLTEQYTDWKGQNEALILLATIDFDWQAPEEAFETLDKITDSDWQAQITNLKKTKLAKMTIDGLSNLYGKNSSDDIVGKILLTKLYSEDPKSVDAEFLQKLQEKYNPDGVALNAGKENQKKSVYDIAVLLPFRYHSLSTLKSSFVVDLYEGILLAQEKLESDGYKVNLHTFDTDRDSLATAKILANPEMKKMDLIIGPLYNNTLPLVQEFSIQNQIPMVNPMSESLSLIEGNPFGLLTVASVETQAKVAANFAIDSLASRTAYIITSSDRDTTMAIAYQKELERRGGVVKDMIRFGFDKMAYYDLVENLQAAKKEQFIHIFIATQDEVVGKTSLSAILNQAISAPIIAPSSWLEMEQMSVARLEQLNTYFVAPYFIDEKSDKVKGFSAAYVDKVNTVPSKYAYLGYETMYFFGRTMHQFGTGFYESIKENDLPFEPILFDRASYKKASDNQKAPVLKLEEGRLVNLLNRNGDID